MANSPTVLSLYGLEPKRVGGTEALVREITIQLAERGWRHVVAFSGPPSIAAREYLEHPNLTLEVVEHPGDVRAKPLIAVKNLLYKYRPSVLHFSYTGFIGPYPWLARFCGVKRVLFTDQGSHPEGYQPRHASAWKRLAARAINLPLDRAICVSNSNRKILASNGTLAPERIIRIYNGIYLEHGPAAAMAARFRERFAIPADRSVVLQVSWIIPEKGIDDLLEAAALVLQQRRNVQFVFAGEGKSMTEFQAKAAGLRIDGNVTWTGLLQNPLEDGAFAAADVVCQVSRWTEAFGMSISEAMSFCRPIVATTVGGIPELVDEGVSGYLVPKRDPQAIADRVLRLLGNPSLRAQMGAAGRQKAEKNFDLHKIAAQILLEYGVS